MQRGGFVKKAKCPKCGGSIFLDQDIYGWFEQCIQCGYTQNLQKVSQVNSDIGDKYNAELEQQPAPIK